MLKEFVIKPTQENIDIINEEGERCGRKRGFYASAYRDYSVGFAFSILYHTVMRDFCIWIQIGVFSIYIGYDFYKKTNTLNELTQNVKCVKRRNSHE